MDCSECGQTVRAATGYAVYGERVLCLPCDAAEPDGIDLSPEGMAEQERLWREWESREQAAGGPDYAATREFYGIARPKA